MSSQDSTSIDESGSPKASATESQRLSSEVVWSLYEAHAEELLAFLVGVLHNIHDAKEISQITFRRLLEIGHTAHDETRKGWIFKVALREALLLKRAAARKDKHLKNYSLVRQDVALIPSNDFISTTKEEIARLKQMLTQLPADQQHVVRERIYEAKTFATIATELNIPVGTVLTRMRLAVEKLRKWLEND